MFFIIAIIMILMMKAIDAITRGGSVQWRSCSWQSCYQLSDWIAQVTIIFRVIMVVKMTMWVKNLH